MLNRHNSDTTILGRRLPPVAVGINFIGYTQLKSGLGSAARGNLKVLRKILPVMEFPFPSSGDIVGNPYTINFHHWHPEKEMFGRIRRNPVDVFYNRYNIGFWVCETADIPRHWVEHSEFFDEIWTASSFCKEVFEDAGVQAPVRVWPHAMFHVPPYVPRKHQPLLGGFHFLMIYDSDSRISRKNPDGVIRAFQQAFPGNEDVKLTIKLRHARPGEVELLRVTSHWDPRVQVISKELPREDMTALYDSANALVSLHRGEGFGLHIAEAMTAGLPCVVTAAGGCMDFTTHANSWLVACNPEDVNDVYFGEAPGYWWDPDTGHAAIVMRHLWEDYASAETLSKVNAALQVGHNLSPRKMQDLAFSYLQPLL